MGDGIGPTDLRGDEFRVVFIGDRARGISSVVRLLRV